MPLATQADLPALVPLFRALHTFHAERMPLQYHAHGAESDYLAFLQAQWTAGAWMFLHEAGWGPVAYLMAQPRPAQADFLAHAQRVAVLDHLYVAPTHRARGLGHKLVAEMETRMRAHGLDRWRVAYNSFNTGADRFYAACGARPQAGFRSKRLT